LINPGDFNPKFEIIADGRTHYFEVVDRRNKKVWFKKIERAQTSDEIAEILKRGTKVKLKGISKEYNGKKATIKKYDMVEGRYQIKLEANGEVKWIKEKFLEVISVASPGNKKPRSPESMKKNHQSPVSVEMKGNVKMKGKFSTLKRTSILKLNGSQLSYVGAKGKKKSLIIDEDSVVESGKDNEFYVRVKNRTYQFEAPGKTDKNNWVEALENCQKQ